MSARRATAQDFELLAELIRSDQMTAQQIQHLLADRPDFAEWYRGKS